VLQRVCLRAPGSRQALQSATVVMEGDIRQQKAAFASDKEPIELRIAPTDRKIDESAYKLYGLTDEETTIVD
jgi:hypothetical protein